jgi:futalosine hydrolase
MILFLVMICLIFPTEAEIEPLVQYIEKPARVETGRRLGYKGFIYDKIVRAFVSGVGQANTAQSLASLIELGPTELVVMGGCAGAYQGTGINVGDVCVATEEIYADLGVITPFGWKGVEEIGLQLLESRGKSYFSSFPVSQGYRQKMESAAQATSFLPAKGSQRGPKVHFGKFLTVSTISGAAERGNALYARYQGICENMEGAAAAQVSLLYGVPFIEVRGVSNMVEDRDKDKWDIPTAAANCASLIARTLERL